MEIKCDLCDREAVMTSYFIKASVCEVHANWIALFDFNKKGIRDKK